VILKFSLAATSNTLSSPEAAPVVVGTTQAAVAQAGTGRLLLVNCQAATRLPNRF
jgi:hypothetical protein